MVMEVRAAAEGVGASKGGDSTPYGTANSGFSEDPRPPDQHVGAFDSLAHDAVFAAALDRALSKR